MSYATFYFMEISHERPNIDEVAAAVADLADPHGTAPDPQFWKQVLQGELDAKWYESEAHLRRISRRWPNVLFTLSGEGEDHDDQWIQYHQNGRMHEDRRPPWQPAPFDPGKLS